MFSPFTGYNCQVNIDECASNPCLNQGTCFDDISGYTCHCVLPYTGGYCRAAGARELRVCPVLGSTNPRVSVAALRTQPLGLLMASQVTSWALRKHASGEAACFLYAFWYLWGFLCSFLGAEAWCQGLISSRQRLYNWHIPPALGLLFRIFLKLHMARIQCLVGPVVSILLTLWHNIVEKFMVMCFSFWIQNVRMTVEVDFVVTWT